MTLYRANFGDGTHSRTFADMRDAKLAVWGRAGIVQYRSSVEASSGDGTWITVLPSRASLNGPPIVEMLWKRGAE